MLLVLVRLVTISWNHSTFERCFAWITDQMERSEALSTNRLLLKKENAPMDTVLMEWGVPFTAMHLSALAGPKAAKTLLIMPDFSVVCR